MKSGLGLASAKEHILCEFNALRQNKPKQAASREVVRKCQSPVTDLAKPFDISLNSVSKHIRMLEKANLVLRRRAGREHWLRFNREPLDEAAAWIESQRTFWNDRLDALEAELNKPEP